MSFPLLQMYESVFPRMEELFVRCEDGLGKLWPECAFTLTPEVVLLGDLTQEGFKTTDRRHGLDLRHSLLAVQALARYRLRRKREKCPTVDVVILAGSTRRRSS